MDSINLAVYFIVLSFEALINNLKPPHLPPHFLNLSKARVKPELPSMPRVLEAAWCDFLAILFPAGAQMETETKSNTYNPLGEERGVWQCQIRCSRVNNTTPTLAVTS